MPSDSKASHRAGPLLLLMAAVTDRVGEWLATPYPYRSRNGWGDGSQDHRASTTPAKMSLFPLDRSGRVLRGR